MRSNKEEKKWKKALTSIIEELSKSEYEKMLHLLDDIPKSKKKLDETSRDEMPQIIIQHMGIFSIRTMEKILEKIPRRDSAVQDLLRPFVDKLSKSPEENNEGPKRTYESDTEDEEPKAAPKKQKFNVIESETESEEDREEKKHQSDKEMAGPSCEPWRQTVQELNAIGYLKDKNIMGKVIQKSGLRPYETKKKERNILFFVGFADNTDATKLTVYGRQHFDTMQEGHFYNLKNLLVDEQAKRVTRYSSILKLGHNTPLTISDELEMKAKKLINLQWPVFSIADAKDSEETTEMTIEGIIIDLNNVEEKKVKGARTRRPTKLRKLTLQDDSGSITVCFWGDKVDQCNTLSVGDTIRVANVRSKEFMGTMSLNATGMTWVYPVKAASDQTGRIQIIGIMKASKMETTLEAEFNQQLQKFVVESKLLAKACGFRLEGNFEDKLLDKMPFWAEVTMQGNKITAIAKM